MSNLLGGATAEDMIMNTSYIPADSAPTTGTAPPAQPKKGIAKRTERKGSVYDGFGGDDPTDDEHVGRWLAMPATSKDAASGALARANAGTGSFCFRNGSTGLVICVLTDNGEIGHFRLQQVGDA